MINFFRLVDSLFPEALGFTDAVEITQRRSVSCILLLLGQNVAPDRTSKDAVRGGL